MSDKKASTKLSFPVLASHVLEKTKKTNGKGRMLKQTRRGKPRRKERTKKRKRFYRDLGSLGSKEKEKPTRLLKSPG